MVNFDSLQNTPVQEEKSPFSDMQMSSAQRMHFLKTMTDSLGKIFQEDQQRMQKALEEMNRPFLDSR